MSKKSSKCGLLLTDKPTFVSVAHQSGDFFVAFDANCDDNVFMRMTIPYFRVISSLVRYAVNYLEPDSPFAASLQRVLFGDFDRLLKLVWKHSGMVKSFKNSPR